MSSSPISPPIGQGAGVNRITKRVWRLFYPTIRRAAAAAAAANRSREGQPQGCNIKGNINARGDKIYHLPGSSLYAKTNVDEDLTTEQLQGLNIHYVKLIDEVLEIALPSSPHEVRQDAEEREKVLTQPLV